MNTVVYSSTQQRQVWRVIPDLIRARELLLGLVWRDLRVRYRDATFGFLWAVLEPLLLTLILTFVFTFAFANRNAGAAVEGQPPFALLILSGLAFWQFLAMSVNRALHSLIECANLVNRVFFPREIIPISSVCFTTVDFTVGLVVLLILRAISGYAFEWAICWLFIVFFVEFCLVLGLALLFSCGNVFYRDVGFFVPVGLTFGFYASPVFYPAEWVANNVPAWVFNCYMLNPMACLITASRQILFGLRTPDLWYLAWPGFLALLALVAGLTVFRRASPTFSDHI